MVKPLAVGRHEVRLELEGAPALVIAVDAAAGQAARYAGPPILVVTSAPPGAEVRSNGALIGVTPMTSAALGAGPHTLTLTAAGHEPKDAVVSLSAGGISMADVALVAKVKGRALARRPAKRPPAPAAAPVVVEAVKGFLTVNTKPWTKVSVGGVPKGSTPLFKVELSPGKHELRLINEGAKVDAVRRITIAPGRVTKLDVDLRKR